MTTVIDGITIDVRSKNSLYVTINGMIFYIEHSGAAPRFVDYWEKDGPITHLIRPLKRVKESPKKTN
jgi:hypothetical protein